MNLEKDAYGQQVMSYLKGKRAYEVIERDDGYVDVSSGAEGSYFNEYKDWNEPTKKAMEFVKGRVLDIGAGAGRIGLYLSEQGFDVLSIDNSPLAIEVCKERGFG